MYGYQQYVKWLNRSILSIPHVLSSKSGSRCDAHHCFAVAFVVDTEGHHLSLMMYRFIMSGEAHHVWLPAVCHVIKEIYINHNPCVVFKKRLML
jgi:hypothetical protein